MGKRHGKRKTKGNIGYFSLLNVVVDDGLLGRVRRDCKDGNAALVWLVLFRKSWWGGESQGYCQGVSVRWIAKVLGLSLTTVRRAVKGLKEAGYIDVLKGGLGSKDTYLVKDIGAEHLAKSEPTVAHFQKTKMAHFEP